MKKRINFIVAMVLSVLIVVTLVTAQPKLHKSTFINSGGSIGLSNGVGSSKLSGTAGQFVTEKKPTRQIGGLNLHLYEGFWTPLVDLTSVEDGTEQANVITNFPNPFSGNTTIKFNLPAAAEVTLKIYDIAGNEVQVLLNGIEEGGEKVLTWDGKDKYGVDLASGSYLYELNARPYSVGYSGFKEFSLRNVMVIVR